MLCASSWHLHQAQSRHSGWGWVDMEVSGTGPSLSPELRPGLRGSGLEAAADPHHPVIGQSSGLVISFSEALK